MKYEGTANSLVEARDKAVEMIKDYIKKNGVTIPIKGKYTYSNDKIDGWFRAKEVDQLKRFNRSKGEMEGST